MYSIHYRRHLNSKRSSEYLVLATGIQTLEEAREKRIVSGDLVVYTSSGEVVKDDAWLWNWEKNNPDSWAYNAIQSSCSNGAELNALIAKAYLEYPYT